MAADFWTCKPQSEKYLGVRVYSMDHNWDLRSVLIGTRRFDPGFGERSEGIHFGQSREDFYGAMSHGGSDVRWMMTKRLDLEWEWCVAHMTNAATKHAFGIEPSSSRNLEMTQLIYDIRRTVPTVKEVEVMGTLFEALCQLEGKGNSRIIEKWMPLGEWFDARTRAPGRPPPPPFPLAGKFLVLVHLLSLLRPITELNKMSQSEHPTQVQTLISLYHLRMVTLNRREPLKDYRSTTDTAKYIAVTDLSPMVAKARRMLADALSKRFASKVTKSLLHTRSVLLSICSSRYYARKIHARVIVNVARLMYDDLRAGAFFLQPEEHRTTVMTCSVVALRG